MDIILHKLDKIIELLEFMKNHHHIQLIPSNRPYIYQGGNLIPAVEDINSKTDDFDSTTNTDPVCNCHEHRSGESTVGWFCPVHGQRF